MWAVTVLKQGFVKLCLSSWSDETKITCRAVFCCSRFKTNRSKLKCSKRTRLNWQKFKTNFYYVSVTSRRPKCRPKIFMFVLCVQMFVCNLFHHSTLTHFHRYHSTSTKFKLKLKIKFQNCTFFDAMECGWKINIEFKIVSRDLVVYKTVNRKIIWSIQHQIFTTIHKSQY